MRGKGAKMKDLRAVMVTRISIDDTPNYGVRVDKLPNHARSSINVMYSLALSFEKLPLLMHDSKRHNFQYMTNKELDVMFDVDDDDGTPLLISKSSDAMTVMVVDSSEQLPKDDATIEMRRLTMTFGEYLEQMSKVAEGKPSRKVDLWRMWVPVCRSKQKDIKKAVHLFSEAAIADMGAANEEHYYVVTVLCTKTGKNWNAEFRPPGTEAQASGHVIDCILRSQSGNCVAFVSKLSIPNEAEWKDMWNAMVTALLTQILGREGVVVDCYRTTVVFHTYPFTRTVVVVMSSLVTLQRVLTRGAIPTVLAAQTVWLSTPLWRSKLWRDHFEHGRKLYDSFQTKRHVDFAIEGGWTFLGMYASGLLLLCLSLLLGAKEFAGFSDPSEDRLLACEVGAVIGQVGISSSFLVYETGLKNSVPRKGSFAYRGFVAITATLSLLGAALAVLASDSKESPATILESPATLSAVCVVGACLLTHGLGGRSYHGAEKYRFFQPFVGGQRFIWYQAIAWAALAACVISLLLTLLCNVGTCLNLFVPFQSHHFGMSAGMSGLVAQCTMVFSIVVFEAPEYKAGIASPSRETSKTTRKRSFEGRDDLLYVCGGNRCERALRRVHAKIYPPPDTGTPYYWYRTSRWGQNVGGSQTSLIEKYCKCAALGLATAAAGSGHLGWTVVWALERFGIVPHLPVDDMRVFALMSIGFCLVSGAFTAATYYAGASRLESAYDNLQRDAPERWKIQRERVLDPKRHAEAVRWSLINSFLAGVVGTGIFMIHLARTRSGGDPLLTTYFTLDDAEGAWSRFFAEIAFVYVWIDLWAYWAHRFLHMKCIYKYVHKWHHRYQPPTAFTAFAMHPLEFIFFQMGGISCCFLFRIHIVAFMANALLVAYHGQVDHSGIDFEGDLPWQPSVHFHDDHHKYFHVNFGQSLIVWDWLFGTLRQRKRLYGESIFVGDCASRISDTEAAALNSGTVGFDRDIFSGSPSLDKLERTYENRLTAEEREFYSNECETLCEMIDDYQILLDQNLPPEVWTYIREKGFLGLCISPEYGGKGFSAHAHSVMLQKVATRSIAAGVTVMVPNSLGPAELLREYGTQAQKDHFLPRLAKGVDIPCFALTGPSSGSDAASMRDRGIVCKNADGVLGIRCTFNKRYITLGTSLSYSPVATLVGLAVDVHDPEGLLDRSSGAKEGITVMLLPSSHPGLETGPRHNPVDSGFMNGTVRGTDVFVPLDQVVGGQGRVGFGWNMLMECLGEGRGISLPASAGAIAQLSVHAVGGYSRIRKQFKVPIAEMEGVQERLAVIASNAFTITSAQELFNAIVGNHERPPVLSAIMKLRCTELGRDAATEAMDILGGAGICKGPSNFMGNAYQSIPVAITVEGSNTLTRSLIVFGQGLNRAHPVMQDLIASIQDGDDAKGFHKQLLKLVSHAATNAGRSFGQSIARRRSKGTNLVSYYESQLQRLASAFAFSADLGMTLGGKLKVAEMQSGRFADILSEIYLGYAMLWYRQKNASVDGVDRVMEFAMDRCLHRIETAFFGIFDNFPIRPVAWTMRAVTFPFGRGTYAPPSDRLVKSTSQLITTDTEIRRLLSSTVFVSSKPTDRVREIDAAFPVCIEADKILADMRRTKRQASDAENALLERAEELRERIIQVDAFEQLVHPHEELVRGTTPLDTSLQKQGLQRQSSFASSLAERDPVSKSVREGGTEGHNDPHANRGKDMNTAMGWKSLRDLIAHFESGCHPTTRTQKKKKKKKRRNGAASHAATREEKKKVPGRPASPPPVMPNMVDTKSTFVSHLQRRTFRLPTPANLDEHIRAACSTSNETGAESERKAEDIKSTQYPALSAAIKRNAKHSSEYVEQTVRTATEDLRREYEQKIKLQAMETRAKIEDLERKLRDANVHIKALETLAIGSSGIKAKLLQARVRAHTRLSRRRHAVTEVLTNEAAYVKSLKYVVEAYLDVLLSAAKTAENDSANVSGHSVRADAHSPRPRRSSALLGVTKFARHVVKTPTKAEIELIFGNVRELCDQAIHFYSQIQRILSETGVTADADKSIPAVASKRNSHEGSLESVDSSEKALVALGELFRTHHERDAVVLAFQNFFSTFMTSSHQTIERAKEKYATFRSMCKLTMMRDVESYLVVPVQRLPRRVLLLKEIRKSLHENTPCYHSLTSAIAAIETSLGRCESHLNTVKLIELQKREESAAAAAAGVLDPTLVDVNIADSDISLSTSDGESEHEHDDPTKNIDTSTPAAAINLPTEARPRTPSRPLDVKQQFVDEGYLMRHGSKMLSRFHKRFVLLFSDSLMYSRTKDGMVVCTYKFIGASVEPISDCSFALSVPLSQVISKKHTKNSESAREMVHTKWRAETPSVRDRWVSLIAEQIRNANTH
eukprot:g120.t1